MEREKLVEHLFRTEYGKLLAALTRFFGTSHIELAEDVVQDTLISALNHWSTGEIPKNPSGWLVQVARRKAINELNRIKMMNEHHQSMAFSQLSFDEVDTIFLEGEIEDNQLRMIFTCCHTALKIDSQIALILKTLCGFGVQEVAHALLTSESNINKKLYRAKEKIRNSQLPFSIPQGEELNDKLDTVGLTLYLLFNEGYNSTLSNSMIQKDLCLEAMRLTKLLTDHFNDNHKLYALLALMCFHAARFDARIDDRGAIIVFEDQDRKQWNKELINTGMHYFQQSVKDKQLTSYHIEARIAAEHCMSRNFDSTNWKLIYDQYVLLQQLKPNPIIQLNLAIIQSKLEGIEVSLKLLEELAEIKELNGYHLLPATQGIFHMKLENYNKAIPFLKKALSMDSSQAESDFISAKIEECQKLLPAR